MIADAAVPLGALDALVVTTEKELLKMPDEKLQHLAEELGLFPTQTAEPVTREILLKAVLAAALPV